ncbi:MAG: hypothetical protein WAV85_12750 [Rhodoferax sp.]
MPNPAVALALPSALSLIRHRTLWTLLLALSLLWGVAVFWGLTLLLSVGVVLAPSGHAHLYAHGHPFVDARIFWGVPNAMDVLSNLPLGLAGLMGLLMLRGKQMSPPTRHAMAVFFGGLICACLGSSGYHWAPNASGLMLDRLGMAVTFAGALGLALAERVGPTAAKLALPVMLASAALSAALAYTLGNVLPWGVVQFGGMALIAWAAWQPRLDDALGVSFTVLIGLYAVAKLCELNDEALFHLSGEWISGHTLKHLVAALAAWPVIATLLRQNAQALCLPASHARSLQITD